MTKTKVMSERDKQVQVRNAMLDTLNWGCHELNRNNREPLANMVKCIHNEMKGFSTALNTEDVYEFFGDDYTGKDGIIVVKEGKREIIIVLQLKSGMCKGEWRAYEANPYDFEYDEQIEAEYQWEQEAESAYEKYLDAKCMYDDPRGQ